MVNITPTIKYNNRNLAVKKILLGLGIIFLSLALKAQCSQAADVVKYRTMAQAGINTASCNECAALALFMCEIKSCSDDGCRKQMSEIIESSRSKLMSAKSNSCCEELLSGIPAVKSSSENKIPPANDAIPFENTIIKLSENILNNGQSNPELLFDILSQDLSSALLGELGTDFRYDQALFYGNSSYDFVQSGGLENILGLVTDYIAAREEGERIAAEFRPKIQELISKSAKYRMGEYIGLGKRPSVSNINRMTRIGTYIFVQFIGKTMVLQYKNGRYEEIAELEGNGVGFIYDGGNERLYSAHFDGGVVIDLKTFSKRNLSPEEKKSVSMKFGMMASDGKQFLYPQIFAINSNMLGGSEMKSKAFAAPSGYKNIKGLLSAFGQKYMAISSDAISDEDVNRAGGGIILMNVETQTMHDFISSASCRIPLHCGIKRMAFSPDDRFLAFSTGNTHIQQATHINLGVEACMAGSGNDAVQVYDIAQKRVTAIFGNSGPSVLDLMFTRDGKLLLVLRNSIDRRLEIWDTQTGKLLKIVSTSFQKFEVMEGMCRPKRQMSGQLFLSPDHKVLAVLGAVTNNATLKTADNSLEFFDFHEIMKDMLVAVKH